MMATVDMRRHLSPAPMAVLSRDVLVKMVQQGVSSHRAAEQEAGNNSWLGQRYFSSRDTTTVRRHAMKTMQDLLASVPHLFQSLASELHKRDPMCTEVILHPLLRSLEVNPGNLALVLDQGHKLTNLNIVHLLFDIKRQSGLESQLFNFIGSLYQLTKLKLSNCCTDQLLAVLATSCPNLKVFDAEEDTEMTITDHGVAFLSNCKQLTSVVLNDDGDEYDYEDRYFGVSGKGIAQLIISLPRLSLLVCEPYLMREAVKFIYPLNINNNKYSLKYLHSRFPSRDSLLTAASLFPRITELRLEDPNKDVAQALDKMTHLQTLVLTNYTWMAHDEPLYQGTLQKLTTLVLKNPKMSGVSLEFIKKIGEWCQNLTSFSLTLYYRDLLIHPTKVKNRQEFFPKLQSLTIEGDASLALMETMLSSIGNLRSLSLFVHSFSVPGGLLDGLILDLVKEGNLSSLEVLQCFQWEVSLDTLLYLIDSGPRLRQLWGIDLLMLSSSGVRTIREHIRKNNLNISLHDGIAPESPRGLNFLSERSHLRVESSDHGAQADLESILEELNLI